ncbi:acetyl-CoA hydrolase/transferase family protein [Viridibacillus sp. FSL H8-0110]|uniref:acetyl-CoA hydrolase/transferase family protein n=1 Tax=Viridibacillus sp. FSL H8-0110 TaxID=2921376 RepID=UPI0030F8520B
MVNIFQGYYKQKLKKPQDVLSYIEEGADIIIPISNGEPVKLLDVLEENAEYLKDVRIHQMLTMHPRKYIGGAYKGHLSHVSYFLSGATRKAYHNGHCELMPNYFHEVPRIMKDYTKASLVMAVASPMDEHGYFTLGTQADYAACFIGNAPFFLEVNEHMPRTFGQNLIHISQIEGFIEHHTPLVKNPDPVIEEKDIRIAEYVAEYIKNGDTLQAGIGSIPNAVISLLNNHRHLGIHTELITDGVVGLVEKGVVDGSQKKTNKGKIVGTFALGTDKLYEFLHNNPIVEFQTVDVTNDPRLIAKEDNIVSINATTEVDIYGQCASETVAGKYYSSTGGQFDFARGANFAENGRGFICMHSTTKNDTISRIKVLLTNGSVVTTSKNEVDKVVTEYGVAELKGKSISARAKALIEIAHPKFKDELIFEAKKLNLM